MLSTHSRRQWRQRLRGFKAGRMRCTVHSHFGWKSVEQPAPLHSRLLLESAARPAPAHHFASRLSLTQSLHQDTSGFHDPQGTQLAV